MAKSVLELAVGTGQWDSGLKKAQRALNNFVDASGGLKEALDRDSKSLTEFVKMMGNMDSTAKTARGQVKEYTASLEQLNRIYNSLSETEKNCEIGKALTATMESLTNKVKTAKSEIDSINTSLGNTKTEGSGAGNILDQLASKFGMNIKQLAGWGAALAAGKAALDTAKDAFFASEQNLDAWNRSIYSAKSTYEAFLTSLNTGDISGFLSNIDEIVKAASDAYNAVDRLQTLQNIQSPKVAQKQAEVQRMENMLRTGRYIAPADGRKAAMAEGTVLNDVQKRQIADNLASAMREIAALTKNEVQASTDAINALYREQALRLGMSNEEFRKGTASMAAFEANLEKARKAQEWEERNTSTYTGAGGVLAVGSGRRNPYEAYKGWGVFKDDGDLYQRIIQLIQQRSGAESQYYGQMGRAYRGINRAEGVTTGGTGNATPKVKTMEGGIQGLSDLTGVTVQTYESMASLRQKLNEYQRALDNATNIADEMAARKGIADTQWKMSDEGRQAAKIGWDQEDLREQAQQMKEALESGIGPIEVVVEVKPIDTRAIKELDEDGMNAAKAVQKAAEATNALGSAVAMIDDPTARIIALVAEGIAGVMAGAGKAMRAKDTTESGYAWIGAAATIITEAAAIAAQIHTIAGYEQGGIVGGNSYSGDNVFAGNAWVNSGELVLSKAQQNTLAASLQEADNRGGVSGTPYVTGENIYLGLNNYLRRLGRGEIITSK